MRKIRRLNQIDDLLGSPPNQFVFVRDVSTTRWIETNWSAEDLGISCNQCVRRAADVRRAAEHAEKHPRPTFGEEWHSCDVVFLEISRQPRQGTTSRTVSVAATGIGHRRHIRCLVELQQVHHLVLPLSICAVLLLTKTFSVTNLEKFSRERCISCKSTAGTR